MFIYSKHNDYFIDTKRHSIQPLTTLPALTTHNNNNIKPNEICIFMVVTPEILDYAKHSIEINQNYAKQHGYQFYVFNQNLTPDLPINFCKLQCTLDLMKNKNYKYIIHIDADAVFIRSDYPLSNIISHYMKHLTSFIAGEDCYNYKICSKPGRMNSGVYIVKNNNLGKKIIQTWLNSVRYGKCQQYKNKFPNCQLVFHHCVYQSYLRMFIKIVPYNLLNGKDGLFIQHMMQHDNYERSDQFKSIINKNDDHWKTGNKRISVY